MISLVLNTFYPDTFDDSLEFADNPVLERNDIVKLSYMATKDKQDEFQLELVKEGDKYLLSMYSTDSSLTLYPTEYNNEQKALKRFNAIEQNVKDNYDIVEESDKSNFTNESVFKDGGRITLAQSEKVAKVMREYKLGKLKTGSGMKVKDRKQAIAIALNEAGLSKKEMGGYIASFDIPTYNTDLDRWALGDMNAGTSDSYFIR